MMIKVEAEEWMKVSYRAEFAERVLRDIAKQDWRGNQPHSAFMAEEALKELAEYK